MASCLSFFSILFVAVAVVQAEQCKQATDCSWEGNYLVARIWKAIDRNGGVTMQDVSDMSERDFAPILAGEQGFKAYLGAPGTFNKNWLLLFDVFETEEEAMGVQDIESQELKNLQIEPETITQGPISFQFAKEKLCDDLDAKRIPSDFYIDLKAYRPNKLPVQEIVDNVRGGLEPALSEQDGFLMHLGAAVKNAEGEDLALFMYVITNQKCFFCCCQDDLFRLNGGRNMFQTEDQADAANESVEDKFGAESGPDVFDATPVVWDRFKTSFAVFCPTSVNGKETPFSFSFSM